MQIRKLRLKNYKSFRDSGWVNFSAGFTVVVGQNNAGKSTLLEAFKLNGLGSKPHRNISGLRSAPLDPRSLVEAEVKVSGQELRATQLLHGISAHIPVPADRDNAGRISFAQSLYDEANLTLRISAGAGEPITALTRPSHSMFQSDTNPLVVRSMPSGDKQNLKFEGPSGNTADDLPTIVQHGYPASIYVFRAERLNIGRIAAEGTSTLSPNGANLAAVLMMMQSNYHRFEKFNAHVSEIFPTIKRVTVAPIDNQFEVRIWSVDVSTERDDLAIPLQESGTGVGQVLAILYVAMMLENGLIVIDEPNSFLHPGAAKKLIQILRQYEGHQYVLATHSGELIATAEPEIIQLVTWSNGESVVSEMAKDKLDDLRKILLEVGASFSDLFGFDRAVWVEGPTEEACFPRVLAKLRGKVPLGLIFIAVKNTGDFERKGSQKKLIWDLYERLTSGVALLPAVVTFSFDREYRTEREIADLERQSKGRVHFLPRLTYENYLLSSEAITEVLNTALHTIQTSVTIANVESWLSANGGNYISGFSWSGDFLNAEWLATVNAPRLLTDLFDQLSGVNLEYQKTVHSVLLTEWILANRPKLFAELADYIQKLTPQPDDTSAFV